jgi:hypothetical protein
LPVLKTHGSYLGKFVSAWLIGLIYHSSTKTAK